MSASLPDPAAEETELLAGEYVLGTLDPESRLAVERETETDPALAWAVAAWEARLSPLAGLVRAQDPPASLWPRIEASLQGAAAIDAGTAQPRGAAPGADPRRSAPIPRGTAGGRNAPRNLRAWQASTVAGFALAAAIAGIAFLGPQRRPPAPAPMPIERVAGLLPLDHPNAPFFVVQMLPGGAVRVTPVGGLKVAADRDLELWVLKPGESVPHPLGVLPAQGVRLAPGSVSPKSGAKILVSLEPRGGSPTGLPTGPVLSGGTI